MRNSNADIKKMNHSITTYPQFHMAVAVNEDSLTLTLKSSDWKQRMYLFVSMLTDPPHDACSRK